MSPAPALSLGVVTAVLSGPRPSRDRRAGWLLPHPGGEGPQARGRETFAGAPISESHVRPACFLDAGPETRRSAGWCHGWSSLWLLLVLPGVFSRIR